LLLLVVLAVAYLASRRLVITVLIGAVTVAMVSWALSPNLADTRNGDVTVLADIDVQGRSRHARRLPRHRRRRGGPRLGPAGAAGGIGADDTTPMEVGSMTKAMTGLVIADAVSRGEIRMDASVATYLPQLGGSPAGAATMHELVTHTSGYAEFGAATLRRPSGRRPWEKFPDCRHHADDRGGEGPDLG
jgi:CubicO group peptidase (beta-lactamase class C family)